MYRGFESLTLRHSHTTEDRAMDWLATPIPLYIASGLYVVQAGAYSLKGDHGMAICFVAYCFANIGMIISFNK